MQGELYFPHESPTSLLLDQADLQRFLPELLRLRGCLDPGLDPCLDPGLDPAPRLFQSHLQGWGPVMCQVGDRYLCFHRP